ncbi:MAG: hypothetical protein GY820_21005 [Gammaproteobacteria bacterium]|nr:hypothetical protein [Gammaproteobacteria bacterium]
MKPRMQRPPIPPMYCEGPIAVKFGNGNAGVGLEFARPPFGQGNQAHLDCENWSKSANATNFTARAWPSFFSSGREWEDVGTLPFLLGLADRAEIWGAHSTKSAVYVCEVWARSTDRSANGTAPTAVKSAKMRFNRSVHS